MAKQTKPFIVEIKQSRNVRTGAQKPSIWGLMDLRMADDRLAGVDRTDETAAIVAGDRSEHISSDRPYQAASLISAPVV
jgi:hypothetical protein